jgi:hypothetical protein
MGYGFRLPNFRVNSRMPICLICFCIWTLAVFPANAQREQQNPKSTPQMSLSDSKAPAPLAVRSREEDSAPHHFLDKSNIWLFSGIAAVRVLDYTSTRNMLARGREEKLIPDDVVHSTPGFASLEAAGAATSIGISYLLHRTGHHKLERWMSIGHIAVTGFGVARNYALESRHP